jgi:zinc protease
MSYRLPALLCAALVLAAPVTTLAAQDPKPPTAAELAASVGFDPNTLIDTLPNGLRYYIRENRYPAKRAELRLAVKVGSVMEDQDQLGLAHFTEHMAFNGTERFPKQDIVHYLQSIGSRFGPDVNAYTSFDETVYMLSVPTDTGTFLTKGIDILSEWAHAQTFASEEVDAERGVVIEEWRLRRGAGARMQDKQLPVLLKGSQYATRLPIGDADYLKVFPAEAAKRFYRDWYRPDLMAVVAVGDFDKREVEKMIIDRFGRLTNPASPRPRTQFPVPAHAETYAVVATDPEAPNSTVVMYSLLPPREQRTIGYVRDLMVQRLYLAMLNARLGEIAQKPDAPFVFASMSRGYFVQTADAFTLGAGVKPGGILPGFEAALTESERAARFGFNQSELDRARTNSLKSWDNLYATREQRPSISRADELIRHFLQEEFVPGTVAEYELYKKYMPGITLAEVNAFAKQYPPADSRVIMASAPAKEGVSVPTETQLLAVYDAVKVKKLEPYVDKVSAAPLIAKAPVKGRVTATSTIPEIGVTEWKLSNGVRVILKPTDYKVDEVVLSGTSPGGSSLVSDAEYVNAQYAISAVTTGGLGEFSATDLNKKLTGKAANLFPMISARSEGVSGSSSASDVETLMQLVYLRFTAPRADSSAFEAFRQGQKAMLANREASPMSAFLDTIGVTMSGHHVRAQPTTAQRIEQIDLQKAFAIYKERFADASDFTFFIVGDFTIESIRPLVETYLGGLPSLNRKEAPRTIDMRPPAGVVEKTVRKGTEPQSQTLISFNGPFQYSAEERYTMQSMAEILQNRLLDKLREKLGGTYSVSASASGSRDEPRTYNAVVQFGSAPDRADELTRAIFEEVELLKREGPTEADLTKVKEAQRRSRELGLRQNSFWTGQLSSAYTYGDDPRDILKYDDLINGLTAADIRDAAAKYLRADNYVRVTLLPTTPIQ